jgi:protein arginine kinase
LPSIPFDSSRFAAKLGTWLSNEGPENDVVLSCRVRLARNLADHPFVSRLDPQGAEKVCTILQEELLGASIDGETLWVQMAEAPPVLRLMLRERHLISRDLAPVGERVEGGTEPGSSTGKTLPGRAAAFGASETVAVMVNEEDHLRLQAMAGGFDLDLACKRAQDLDRKMENRVRFAFTEQLGYLTGCPTNVGTGLRASVMLHLPALSMVRSELEKVFTAAQRTGLAVRGTYGEGSRAAGDYYQISNQITLGRTEEQLIDDLRALVPKIIEFERRVREALLREQRPALQDRVSRSYGMLRTARAMPTDGALAHLSNLRLGSHLGLLDGASIDLLNELGVQIQKGHLQALSRPRDEEILDASERDRLRASLLRRRLG